MKERIMGVASLCLLAALAGCVSQGAHDQSLRELQSAKSDYERIRVQNEGLTKQLMSVKESNGKLKEEIEKVSAQIPPLNEAIVKERQAGEGRLKDLERQVKELTASKKAVAHELEVAKQRYEDSLKIQKRQAKELKEREQSSLIQPPTQPAKPAAPPAPEPPQPSATSAPASDQLVDINKATPAELTLALELAREDSDRLVKNRPYKTKEELVTKAGIAKATVDKIKDRITVGP
ncbi:MAG: helix-hairpin-helix domain-containing protein [Nitrospirales bacterium]|nr:helix-hairpin-helix domain-containing protein [Nitrospirales bacterium]